MEQGDRARVSATVHGRVQGVFFRDFVRTTATQLGLSGYVRNRPTGEVEVQAEGPVASLKSLSGKLREGPPGAYVTDVDEEWSEYSGQHQGFSVRH